MYTYTTHYVFHCYFHRSMSTFLCHVVAIYLLLYLLCLGNFNIVFQNPHSFKISIFLISHAFESREIDKIVKFVQVNTYLLLQFCWMQSRHILQFRYVEEIDLAKSREFVLWKTRMNSSWFPAWPPLLSSMWLGSSILG